jgi:putative Holliday junction resolvase
MNALGENSSADRVATASASQRILAVDYGRKRIGLAISDELGITARPLVVINRKNRDADLKKLRQICAENAVSRIIVGNPLHITGETSEMAEEATRFAARLKKSLHLEVEMVDERLTSWEARQSLHETRGRSTASRDAVDDIAAAVLLRDYLEHRREAAERD